MEWNKSTTYTVLRKLKNKGAVRHENTMVTAVLTREQAIQDQTRQLEQWAGGLSPFVAAFLGGRKLTQQEALEAAAQTLVTTCSTSRFAVSFEVSSPEFHLPEGRSRLYLTGVDAADAAQTAASVAVADSAVNLVFSTETNDTRFDAYSTMRPMPVPG